MLAPDGKILHAAMKFGDDLIMMGCPPDSKYKNPKRLGQATQSLYTNVVNIDSTLNAPKKQEQKF
jgi:uncharacterized glyoxalase superfamily protein PhnB